MVNAKCTKIIIDNDRMWGYAPLKATMIINYFLFERDYGGFYLQK